MNEVLSPKRLIGVQKSEIYSYYAGYSQSFVKGIFDSLNLSKKALVLDPWNGAGTTTFVSYQLGIDSVGFDLNPVMVIISKIRQSKKKDIQKAKEIVKKVNFSNDIIDNFDDALNNWFTKETVDNIRRLEVYILRGNKLLGSNEKLDIIEDEIAIVYVSLFNIVRGYLNSFIPTNPTWIKKAKTEKDKISVGRDELANDLKVEVDNLCIILDKFKKHTNNKNPKLIKASSTNMPLGNETIDLVLSSPPYCTRIDYAVATAPELALLVGNKSEIHAVRRSLMGTTTVPKEINIETNFGATCNDFLKRVRSHKSRASDTYYFKNLYQYFEGLHQSLNEINRVLKPGAKCILVVQDSHYKEIYCDLAQISIEMCEENGLIYESHTSFSSKRNMVNINTKSRIYRKKNDVYESVISLRKEF